jgi:hypothetical protein
MGMMESRWRHHWDQSDCGAYVDYTKSLSRSKRGYQTPVPDAFSIQNKPRKQEDVIECHENSIAKRGM